MKKREHCDITAGNSIRRGYCLAVSLVLAMIIAAGCSITVLADAAAYVNVTDDYAWLHSFTVSEYVVGNGENAVEEEANELPASLPEEYSSVEMGYITPVKDQSAFGKCWAFSAIAAIEASTLKNHVLEGKTKDNLDLSERHMAFFGSYTPPDPLGNTDGDSVYYVNDEFTCYLYFGNTFSGMFQRLGAYFGIVPESDAPYAELIDGYEEYLRGERDFSSFINETMLENTYENAREKDILHIKAFHKARFYALDEVKKLVMEYGAVSASIEFSESFMNYDSCAYYAPEKSGGIDHSVTIVGWDDHYSRSNFGNSEAQEDVDGTESEGRGALPAHDGAWLVKNSLGPEWGLDGYFWLSYDSYTGEDVYAYEVEPADHNRHVYMHDGGIMDYQIWYAGGSSLANVYKIPKNAEGPQILTRAAFSLEECGEYELQIYRNLTDAADPTSGTPIYETPVIGNTEVPYFCFVDLPEPVVLGPGDTYSLVFTFSEPFMAWLDTSSKFYDINYISAYETGESFYLKADSDAWADAALRPAARGAFRIRGYTSDIPPVDIAEAEVSSVQDADWTGKEIQPDLTVTYGGQLLLEGTDYTLSYAGNVGPGKASVIVTGIGAFTGETSVSFTIRKAEAEPASGFSDVRDPSHPYYKAIYWAADAGITKGYADGTFGINRSCTRGEMLMFLWRFAGKPAPKTALKSPFKDVPTTHVFYKAILWGFQNGIAKGYSDGTFGIDRDVSRGECMMFLWRLKGKPAPKQASKSPFKDVPTSHAFYKAILWGSQNAITKGYTDGERKGTFGIGDNCTRGQIVTFLYRAD